MFMQPIKEKNLLIMPQIYTTFLPDQWIALEQLLMLKIEFVLCISLAKICRHLWLVKKTRHVIKSNHYNAGKPPLGNIKIEQG